nr:beta-galactosidase small subunit [Chitinophagaceae bacterium]
ATISNASTNEFMPVGHEIAREQLHFRGDFPLEKVGAGKSLEVNTNGNRLIFKSGDITGEFDTKTGLIQNYRKANGMQLARMPEPYFWRAPTDNDFGSKMPATLGIWRAAHQNQKVKKVEVGQQTAEGISLKVSLELTGIAVPYTIEYFIQNDGSIRVTADMDMTGRDLPELPRFGMRLQLPPPFENLEYYGRGPWENYSDRKEASFIGLYSDKVKNQFTANYVRPQENGYKTDVRWIRLTNDKGNGIQFSGLQPICFSALHYSAESMDPGVGKKQQHPTDLRPDKNIYLHIDLKQRGVGGDDSWGSLPHEKYRLLEKKYGYSYIISLL